MEQGRFLFFYFLYIIFSGVALSDIVDDFATDQALAISEFTKAIGKMLENGYGDDKLIGSTQI